MTTTPRHRPVVPAPVDVPSGRSVHTETPAPGDPRLARLSLNQATVKRWSLTQAVDGCLRAGLPAIGLWREHVQETGLERSARLVRDAGLRVSSYCRGGFLSDPSRTDALEDNRRAIDEAAELGAPVLVMVAGGLPEGDGTWPVPGSGWRRGSTPWHRTRPNAACASGSNPSTRCSAPTVRSCPPWARPWTWQNSSPRRSWSGRDTYHVWWDPAVFDQIARAGAAGRITSFQVCDWITPLPVDSLLGRGMVGDGHIDARALHRAVLAAGYEGDVEWEVFNEDVWSADGDEVIATMARRHAECVL